ncbi:uncharacterized protein LOC121378891 isoform X5 [Gigantopelta aegis]|uniref:uncharacterized protein LOC121378891 isoform X5 n=1 Tax=Gigantopelta aegis TaxID=1735272 RepID=UPI001B887DC5|nr:uncharacterized protein LOC121378891 isoform X5 [Gigantopelta aegis]
MERKTTSTAGSEQLVVDVKFTKRELIPAVKLEQKKITMTTPPDTVPCTATVSEDEAKEIKNTIVGETSPLGEDESGSKGVPRTNGHIMETSEEEKPGSRPSVQFAELPQKTSPVHVMEFFEEQEKSLQEQFKSLPPHRPRKHRPPVPTLLRQSVGLDHLDNLVRLMEQLALLRDENSHLKKRCAYLESTKDLLQVKSSMMEETVPVGYMSLPTVKTIKPRLKKSNTDPESKEEREKWMGRDRLPSAEDVDLLDFIESTSDQSPKRPRPGPLHKRSFSTGSLEVPSEIFDDSEHVRRKGGIVKSKSAKEGKTFKTKSKSSKSSKWARVKKVLTGQILYEDLGFSFKSLKEIGKGGHFRYHSSTSPQELSPPTPRFLESRSLDSGVSSSLDVDGHGGPRTSTSSAEPASPGRSPNQTEDKEEELSTDIWMGPPEWIEQHELQKISGTSTPSDEMTTVIELKSQYAGKDGDRYLRVKPLPRRQSSPSLGGHDDDEEDLDEFDETLDPSGERQLHRSSSYKGMDSDSTVKDDDVMMVTKSGERESKKLHKTPWSRVKDMIHTRKDSLKKKKHKGGDLELSESSEIDIDDEHLRSDMFGEGVMSRSTPKTSPIAIRQRSSKSCSESPPGAQAKTSPTRPIFSLGSPANMDVAALIATGVSDEYMKKLQEWEELKTRRSLPSHKAAIQEETDGASGQDSSFLSQESMARTGSDKSKGRGSLRHGAGHDSSEEESAEGVTTPGEPMNAAANVDEIQHRITESFSRKLQEWERRKYRKDPGSPEIERKGTKLRKEDRPKSKKSREEKEKEKLEKQREREIQKVEREQVKLDKEKMRLEKERLRALEREAKLEKMKGRLSQSDVDTSFKNPILSPLAEYKVTADFAHKLHEWELMKGLSHDISTAIYLEAQKRSLQQGKEELMAKQELSPSQDEGAAAGESKSKKPPPLMLTPYWDSPEDTSPVEKTSEVSIGDESSITDGSMTKTNIASLERANQQLLEQLKLKEFEYASVQDEVKDLNEKLIKVKDGHSVEMAKYRTEHAASGRPLPVSVGQLETTVTDMEEKIQQLEIFGEKLAESMEIAAIGKWQSIEGEESVNVQLMDLVEQMRIMLVQASQTEEVTLKSTALHNFEKLYSQAMQLQVQMNNLRLSHLQRNKEIMEIKRQLLLQEVNNLMLQADIARRETELHQLHARDAKRHPGTVRRWNTFSGGQSSTVQVPDVPQESAEHPPTETFVSVKETEAAAGDREPPDKLTDLPLITDLEEPEKVEERQEADQVSGGTMSPADTNGITHSRTTDVALGRTEKVSRDQSGTVTKKMGKKKSLERKTAVQDDDDQTTPSLPSARVSLPPKEQPPSQGKDDVSGVEKGSPTLDTEPKKQSRPEDTEHKDDSFEKKTEKPRTETPKKLIPEQVRSLDKPKLVKSAPIVDDEYSPTETVMKCTESDEVDSYQQEVQSDSVSDATEQIRDTTDVKKVPSPAMKSRIPRKYGGGRSRTQDSSDIGRCTSPKPKSKSDPTCKPPIPPQSAPVTHSPVLHVPLDLSTRSHSVDEIQKHKHDDDGGKHSQEHKETTRKSYEFRHTPSPTLHVGVVSAVKRLKPAAELLEESQRYRSGHSIYAQRIIQKYIMKDDKKQEEKSRKHDKENISGIYVQAMVKRLSREGTPNRSVESSKTNSSLSLHGSESPHSQSEFVSHIVRKLSSPSGPDHHKTIAPLKDVTNDGHVKKMTEVFDSSNLTGVPERAMSDSEVKKRKTERTPLAPTQRQSCELGALYLVTTTTTTQAVTTTHPPSSVITSSLKPDSTISPTNHQSMPALGTARQVSFEEPLRDRSATYSATSEHAPKPLPSSSTLSSSSGKRPDPEEIVTLSQDIPSSSSSSLQHALAPRAHSGKTVAFRESSSPGEKSGSRPLSPRLHERRGKKKMGTIGVLCKQSMSFDLGVSRHVTEWDTQVEGISYRKQKSSTSSPRPSSTSSEGEGAPTSPSDEKKHSRKGFLDSRWLQKPKKFFKVSNGCCDFS